MILLKNVSLKKILVNLYLHQYRSELFPTYIASYKVYTFHQGSTLALNPTGNLELIFQIDGDFNQRCVDSNRWSERPKHFMGGLHSKRFEVKPHQGQSKIVSISFTPSGAKHFLKEDLHLFRNSIVDLDTLVNPVPIPSLEWIGTGGEPSLVVKELDLWLLTLFRPIKPSTIDRALQIMISNHGFIRIRELSALVCLSPSRLRDQFNREVGMSPKEYSKILRINRVSTFLKSDLRMSLTELAYKLGYYDQAHFIKDFKSVTGLSPGKHWETLS